MVDITIEKGEVMDQSGGLLFIALTFDRDELTQEGVVNLNNRIQQIVADDIQIENVSVLNTQGRRKVIEVEVSKTSMNFQALEDIRNAAIATTGYRNMWVVCGDILDHPEIIK